MSKKKLRLIVNDHIYKSEYDTEKDNIEVITPVANTNILFAVMRHLYSKYGYEREMDIDIVVRDLDTNTRMYVSKSDLWVPFNRHTMEFNIKVINPAAIPQFLDAVYYDYPFDFNTIPEVEEIPAQDTIRSFLSNDRSIVRKKENDLLVKLGGNKDSAVDRSILNIALNESISSIDKLKRIIEILSKNGDDRYSDLITKIEGNKKSQDKPVVIDTIDDSDDKDQEIYDEFEKEEKQNKVSIDELRTVYKDKLFPITDNYSLSPQPCISEDDRNIKRKYNDQNKLGKYTDVYIKKMEAIHNNTSTNVSDDYVYEFKDEIISKKSGMMKLIYDGRITCYNIMPFLKSVEASYKDKYEQKEISNLKMGGSPLPSNKTYYLSIYDNEEAICNINMTQNKPNSEININRHYISAIIPILEEYYENINKGNYNIPVKFGLVQTGLYMFRGYNPITEDSILEFLEYIKSNNICKIFSKRFKNSKIKIKETTEGLTIKNTNSTLVEMYKLEDNKYDVKGISIDFLNDSEDYILNFMFKE